MKPIQEQINAFCWTITAKYSHIYQKSMRKNEIKQQIRERGSNFTTKWEVDLSQKQQIDAVVNRIIPQKIK